MGSPTIRSAHLGEQEMFGLPPWRDWCAQFVCLPQIGQSWTDGV